MHFAVSVKMALWGRHTAAGPFRGSRGSKACIERHVNSALLCFRRHTAANSHKCCSVDVLSVNEASDGFSVALSLCLSVLSAEVLHFGPAQVEMELWHKGKHHVSAVSVYVYVTVTASPTSAACVCVLRAFTPRFVTFRDAFVLA